MRLGGFVALSAALFLVLHYSTPLTARICSPFGVFIGERFLLIVNISVSLFAKVRWYLTSEQTAAKSLAAFCLWARGMLLQSSLCLCANNICARSVAPLLSFRARLQPRW